MNFPILSTLIFLPLVSSFFIFLSKENKNNNSAVYLSLFGSLATFILSLFIWHSLDSTSTPNLNFIKLFKSCNILQLIYNNYHLTILQLMSPKFVYTQTDNNTLIHWLSKYEKKIRFISIQNGLRTKHEFRYFKNKHLEN